jgi:hypothetical protein
MKLALGTFSFALFAVFVAGCSSSDDAADKTGPVSASPLKGTVEGTEFVAKSAIAKKGFEEGEKSIDIYEGTVTCADFAPKEKRKILISVPWKAGTARDFKFALGGGDSQTATFVIQRDSKTDNIISTQGRVEILEAPTEKGAKGKLRLRAVAREHSVEGEIAVEVCE